MSRKLSLFLLLPVLFLTVWADAQEKKTAPGVTLPPTFRDTATGMEFVLVKGGCFDMGDIFGEGDTDESPVQ